MKYRTQKYCACQIITAINARIFLGRGDICNRRFEKMVDEVCARIGSAIQVHRIYPELGLEYSDGPTSLEWIRMNLPVELSIYSTRWGFHSVLVHKVHHDKLHVLNNGPHNSLYWPTLISKQLPPFDYQRRTRSFRLAPYIP